ncbi:hypothetical protein QN277_003507 [Acacia crassicarpa]|uniref:C2H2-type domain-containing protein n=1 Tax=Acacia crassicarpa TaxID=499986 RepID=A0AAE1J1L7_9FABA|nr:hypothetical protein QN277_003507 [Acacia crassicarpa]
MEGKHKCKLCSRTFAHGRSLGGHMKAHFATLPLPPKPQPPPAPPLPPSPSFSSSSSQDSDEKALIYTLRENPKKSFRLADPEFSVVDTTGSGIVQDRESETESKNPTRLRSKRARTQRLTPPKRPKPSVSESPPASSVSETSTEEDVAMCLIMLSRDKWKRIAVKKEAEDEEDRGGYEKLKLFEEIKVKKGVRGKHQCEKCRKTFRSFRALGSHRNVCFRDEEEARNAGNNNTNPIFECPFCYKVFGSGQALGGHKRSHLVPSSPSTLNHSATLIIKESFIDLNLPAPLAAAAEDELSVVSDA